MKKMLYIVALFISGLFAGCVDEAANIEKSPLESNYEKWKSLEINDYSITQQHTCFCIHGGIKAIVIVRGNKIVNIQNSEGGVEIRQELWQYYKTVDQLFETLNNAVLNKPHSLKVEYDSVFGFPNKFFVDPNQQMADEEYGYITNTFRSHK